MDDLVFDSEVEARTRMVLIGWHPLYRVELLRFVTERKFVLRFTRRSDDDSTVAT